MRCGRSPAAGFVRGGGLPAAPPPTAAGLLQAGPIRLRVPAARRRPEVGADLPVRGEPPPPPFVLRRRLPASILCGAGERRRPAGSPPLVGAPQPTGGPFLSPADPVGEEHHAGRAPRLPALLVVVSEGRGGWGGSR